MSAEPWNIDPFSAMEAASDLASFLGLLAVGIVAIFLFPILFLLLITGVEWLVLLVLLPIALVGRLLFGKHWMVSVKHQDCVREFDGGSWRESAALIQQLAAQITAGDLADGLDPDPVAT